MFVTLTFPNIGPELFHIDAFQLLGLTLGPFALRWYALAYIVGLLLGWRYCIWLARRPPALVTRPQLDDFLLWAIIAVILGGRLGYVLVYQPGYYLSHPELIVHVWHGGMSFHGGLVGVILAMALFAWRRGIPFLALTDIVAAATPIGLFLGRLANFVNGELYGRPTDVPWAIVFPDPEAGPLPRHPSQLYEAELEGIVLFFVLLLLARSTAVRRRLGVLSGSFLMGYALSRMFVELFRQPDVQLGYFLGGTTMGQWLSLPMLAFGVLLISRARPVDAKVAG